ncbi:protein FAR1-RELATED SEQUENCE 5-like [Nymphaea colorata]|nr:protein FAR1-RELATED SEQUENCE 5-like [Nymphaea colorata]XP_031486388.1 protein FAR1-RELATED SEQUENCE 5-like [Nymphaea colorata]
MESGVSQGIMLEGSFMDSNHGAMRQCPIVDNELPLDKLDDMMGNSAMDELQVHVSPARVDPYVGMEFESEEAVRVYYNEYAKRVGFSIRVSTTRRSKRDSTLIGRDFVCYKEGFRSKKYVSKRPNTREGCKAMIRAKKLDSNKWIVTRLIKDHNHELVGSGTVSLLRSHKHKIFLDALDEANSGLSSVDPYVGMEFESDAAARIFYYQYAKRLGFSIRVATTRRSKRDSTVIGRYFVCSMEGFRIRKYANRRPVMREGCKAMFRVKKLESEKWVVTQFEKDHNHELGFPGKGSYLRESRLVSTSNAAKSSVDCSGHSSEQARATSPIVTVPKEKSTAPSNTGFVMPDSGKHVHSGQKKILGRDAQNVLEYFKRMQAKNPAFFYAIQVDDAYRMCNFLWVDSRSRMAYSHLGDVVTLDTTYRRNLYEMPFVLFIGVDQHKQFVLFGCGLLLDESEASYVWLFNTWVEAMSGQHPNALMTDDDPAIVAAVARVFRKTQHCFCKRHILKKFSKKLGRLESKHKSLREDFLKCINLTEPNDEFESCWWSLLDKYELQENQWLYLLYRSREKWVRVFFQGAFCASVSTGQRNMSINSIFNVNEHTSLLVFVIQCEQAIDGWFEKQLEEDLKSSYMKPILKTSFPMEVQAAEVYTRTIFLEFQDQLIQSLQHVVELTNENGTIGTFKVAEFGAEDISHIVSFDAIEGCASCSCQMFEYAGILCRHVLRVFMVKNIMLLPSNCIWKRWTRSAMNGDATKDQASHIHSTFQENRYLLYKDLCREAISYASEGALSLEIYNLAKRAIRKALEEVRAVKENAAALLQHSSPVVGSIHEENICEQSQPADATSSRHTSHWSKFR